jgi:hypothetical protein
MKKSALENQFKEKINARQIVPSEAAWDRLDAMLAVAEKPKRDFKWMYIAASFLGFLLVGTLYLNQKDDEVIIEKNTVTVNDSKVIPEIKTEPSKLNLVKGAQATKVSKVYLISKENKSEINLNKVLSNTENQVVEQEVIKEEKITIINQKAEQPIVLQKSKYVDVDELLASVDSGSPKKSLILPKSNVKVNSNELLSQVDGELDLTFREKAIITVKQNFKTVKLALSNRNSE